MRRAIRVGLVAAGLLALGLAGLSADGPGSQAFPGARAEQGPPTSGQTFEDEAAAVPSFAPAHAFQRDHQTDAEPDAPPAVAQVAAPAPGNDTERVPANPTVPASGAADKPKPRGNSRDHDVVAAKALFGAVDKPAALAARSIGFYSRGCLAGAVEVPIDGETWQVMRLSRNRNWGHPRLVALLERLAEDGAAKDGWPGLLVGDISQPRGGPMLTGHASHQIGLDADVWLTPMPDRRLTREEREKLAATSMLGKDGIHADPEVFTPYHAAIIRRAASYSQVERVLVHPGIKKAMCEEKGADRTHYHKIRPYWGHHYHMHIRMACPPDSAACRAQPPTSGDDGCGAEVDDWIKRLKQPPKPEPPSKPRPPPKPITLDDLPGECRTVLAAGESSGGRLASPKKPRQKAAHGR